jgi:hypothetical protein
MHLNKQLQLNAATFLQVTKDRIAALPKTEIETWPNYPAIPSFSLNVPPELSSLQFTVMKDIFPDGRVRIAIQCFHYSFLGSGHMIVDGFVLLPDGSRCALTQEDIWDVT